MNSIAHSRYTDHLAQTDAPEPGVSLRAKLAFPLISGCDTGTSETAHKAPRHVLWAYSTSNGCPPPINKQMIRCESGEEMTHGDKICEVHRLSGLTWKQIAEIFDVTVHIVFSWVSGKPMDELDKDRLNGLLKTIRHINRGAPDMTRPVLFTASQDGDTPYDLLTKGLFDDAAGRVGPGNARPIPKVPPVDPSEWTWKLPPPPGYLIGALHDPIHKDTGKYRPVRIAKIKRNRGGEKR